MNSSNIAVTLGKALKRSVTSEEQAVYILVQIGKLLEAAGEAGHQYDAVRFHRNWAVHLQLDGKLARQIVGLFDYFQQHFCDEPKPTCGPEALPKLFHLDSTLGFRSFRGQLGNLLESAALDSSIATDEDKWIAFLSHYVRHIGGIPLVAESSGFHYVERVEARFHHQLDDPQRDYDIAVEWRWIEKKTGIERRNMRFL